MSFIEEFIRLRICLFRWVFCRNLAKHLLFPNSFHTTAVNDGLHYEPYHFTSDKIARFKRKWGDHGLLLVYIDFVWVAQGMFNMGQIYRNSEAKTSARSLFSDKHAVSANHRARYMETLL